MNQPKEDAESILDHANPNRPTEPVNLTLWQTCKAHPWPAAVACLFVVALVGCIFWASSPRNPPAKRAAAPAAPIVAVVAPEPVQTTETPNQLQITPKKIANKAIKTPASGSNFPESSDILGDFIAQIEREKAQKAAVNVAPAMPAPSASTTSSAVEQDFETRLFNFERKIP